MRVQDAARARLRDPWFKVALLLAALFPLVMLAATLLPQDARFVDDPQDVVLAAARPAVNLLPLLVVFLVASAPEVRTRAEAVAQYWGDLAMVGAAFALGWGVPVLVTASLAPGPDLALPAFGVVLAKTILLFAAWRGLAGACDAPGLDSGRLLRRLFVLWLVLHMLVPLAADLFGGNPMDPRLAGVALQMLSPDGAHGLLTSASFPESLYGGFFDARDAFGAWYSPWTFGPLLLAWAIVPYLLVVRKYPDAPPAAPPGDDAPA